MAHYATINENNIVPNVIFGRDEYDLDEGIDSWEDFYSQIFSARVLRTSFNTYGNVHYLTDRDEEGNFIPSDTPEKAIRYNYAAIGFSYDEDRDAFIPPKPEVGDWVLNEDTCLWEPVSED